MRCSSSRSACASLVCFSNAHRALSSRSLPILSASVSAFFSSCRALTARSRFWNSAGSDSVMALMAALCRFSLLRRVRSWPSSASIRSRWTTSCSKLFRARWMNTGSPAGDDFIRLISSLRMAASRSDAVSRCSMTLSCCCRLRFSPNTFDRAPFRSSVNILSPAMVVALSFSAPLYSRTARCRCATLSEYWVILAVLVRCSTLHRSSVSSISLRSFSRASILLRSFSRMSR
mmetsp:Transcript_10485/g.25382  ORF Transcript_10485/g.25382 Transcript_10485/m.25382 type:complete len:232 (-) Transcript_10485:1098-1793(-)